MTNNENKEKQRNATTPTTYYPISIEGMLSRGIDHNANKDKMLAIAIGRIGKAVVKNQYEFIKKICDTDFDNNQHDDKFFDEKYIELEKEFFVQKERKQRLTKIQIELAREYNERYDVFKKQGFDETVCKNLCDTFLKKDMEKYNVTSVQLQENVIFTL